MNCQHWIRLELHDDIVISRLYMNVEPSDSSYMPMLVVVSTGETIHAMKEVKTINIQPNDTQVLLLEDLIEVRICLGASCLHRRLRFISCPIQC